jgi:probable HAF family extracellular repeat protein
MGFRNALRRGRSSSHRNGRRLVLETLETRWVPSYTVTDLGTLGGAYSIATAINGAGQVAGEADAGGADHAYFFDGTTMNDLGTFGGADSHAFGVNSSGQVAGFAAYSSGVEHAFLASGGSLQDLGTLGGAYSYGLAVNDAGQVAGYAATGDLGVSHAFQYDPINGMTDLGTLGTGTVSHGNAINRLGQVAGDAAISVGGPSHAFLYSGGPLVDLGTLGGSVSVAECLNDRGNVVGYSTLSGSSLTHAFRDNGTTMTDLGVLAGQTSSSAWGLNDAGQVVGVSGSRAFLYSNGQMVDLNSLLVSGTGWTLNSATAINNHDQIVGLGQNPNGQFHAYLLTPTGNATAVSHERAAGGGFASLLPAAGSETGQPDMAEPVVGADPRFASLPYLVSGVTKSPAEALLAPSGQGWFARGETSNTGPMVIDEPLGPLAVAWNLW